MKTILTRTLSLGIIAAALLCLAFFARGQKTPVEPNAANTVELKERELQEQADKRLRAKWAAHSKSGETLESTNAGPKLQPNVLLAPEAEKQIEALVPAPQRQSLARATKAEFFEPAVVRSTNKELKVTLVGAYAHNHIGADPVYLRAFNGKLVGPTLRVKRGDKIRLTLKNEMPGERWHPNMMDHLNSFNTMNLHYHGLHVSPNGISDNVLIQVGPHETQEYEINIPADHPPGTYWYHPHRHGSTAGNVASGMSGALIIEGGLDDLPEIKAAKERTMVLNQIPYIYKNTFPPPGPTPGPTPSPTPVTFDLKEGVVEEKYQDYIFGPGTWAGLGRYTTVNGVVLPTIRMRPGEIERWRIVDSGQREMIVLKMIANPRVMTATDLPRMNFREIAVDGLALGKMVETPTIELWPGYRSDVLVQAPPTVGEYLLIDDLTPAPKTMSGEDKQLNYIARVIVEGSANPMKLPTDQQMAGLRLPSITDGEITGKQEATYGILLVAGGDLAFTIDKKPFDMETARTLKLNDVDEWTLRSINDVGPGAPNPATPGNGKGMVTHPFHIHVNPFEVTSIMAPETDKDGKTTLVELLKDGPVWRDTVKIPGGGSVTMRTRYTDFIGTFVQHCHILDHEDQGMMQLIDIVSDKAKTANNSAPLPEIGSVAPDFSLPDAEGRRHGLQELGGKPAVVFFFKGYGCLHCTRQVAAFSEAYRSFAEKGIQIIGITSDTVEILKDASRSYSCPFPLLADPEGVAFARFGCVSDSGVRHGTFSLDAKGQITWRTVGSSPYLGIYDLLENALLNSNADGKQTDPPTKETEAVPLGTK
jgi:FtsP/CotA-like multicopper oxidase with cupredoxin domain/peroxiredoxin